MSTTEPRGFRPKPWIIATLAGIALVVAAGVSTHVVPVDEADAASAGGFDPVVFASENFDDIAANVEDNAVDLADLLADLNGGADEDEFGNTSGAASAFAFPVTFEGVAGAAVPPVMPVTVEGIDAATIVQVQIGPALNGTALRDVTGEISFNQFTNQLEYQQVGTELNSIVRDTVLVDFDAAAAAGKTVKVTGTFLRVNPQLVSVVPVSIEIVG